MAYTKLFKSILTSTIWSEDDKTRIVWITMLASADKNGEIQASIPGLARIAGVPVEDCRKAIEKFLSPDPDSRTTDDEGRRLEKIDGGWALLNFVKYRDMASKEDNRIMAAQRKARWRAKQIEDVTPRHADVTGMSTPLSSPHTPLLSPPSEADAEAEAVAQHFVTARDNPKHSAETVGSPTLTEVQTWASMNGLAPWKAEDWWNEMEGCGWLDYQKRPIMKWKPVLARVRSKWEADGRPSGPPANQAPKQASTGSAAFIRQKELDSCIEQIRVIKSSYEGHQSMDELDRERISTLKTRRDELKKELGYKV